MHITHPCYLKCSSRIPITAFTLKDVAKRELAGTGSLGSGRYYVLIEGVGQPGDVNDDVILDFKEQDRP